MGDTSITQVVTEALAAPDVSPDVSVTQVVVEVLGVGDPTATPDVSVTQLVVEVLGTASADQCFTLCIGKSFLFTAANWTSDVWYFEVFMKAVSGTVHARLHDTTTDVAVPGSEVSTTSTSYVRLRSTSFSLTDGHVYCGRFGVDTGGPTGQGIGMRLINI